LNLEVGLHVHRLSHDIERALNPGYDPEFDDEESECHTELVLIDEADRLRTTGLEQLRDFFDRSDLGQPMDGIAGTIWASRTTSDPLQDSTAGMVAAKSTAVGLPPARLRCAMLETWRVEW
jgi:hypothetical protein